MRPLMDLRRTTERCSHAMGTARTNLDQPTALIISDDSEFSRAVTARWQTERNMPALTLMSGDLCQALDPDTFALADVGLLAPTRWLRAGDAAHDEQRAHVGVGQLGAAVDRARIALRYWTFAARDHPQYGGAPTRDPATLFLNREGNERYRKASPEGRADENTGGSHKLVIDIIQALPQKHVRSTIPPYRCRFS